MKLLAFSDIHNNLAAVRTLRALEQNGFDAVIVAGDIGNRIAGEFFDIVASFACPVLYVFGNWDNDLDYDHSYGAQSRHLHLNVVPVGDFAVTGFSGLPVDWGRNPIAAALQAEARHAHAGVAEAYENAARAVRSAQQHKQDAEGLLAERNRIGRLPEYRHYRDAQRRIKSDAERLNRSAMLDVLRASGADIGRTILVTHERQYRLAEELPGLPLHLFGHQHGFLERVSGATRNVNVSILDRVVPARPRDRAHWSPEDCREINAGNYAVIEIGTSGDMAVRCVHFPVDEWVPVRAASAPSPAAGT